jgi:hypothetical protein
MFSRLRKGLVYTNISSDVTEHDLDIDADQWSYDNKDVYRGSVDPEYISNNLSVYWLYDDDSNRVGLAEHESEDPAVFQALWFYDNSFATLFQDGKWKSTGKTLWSMLTSEAYQDCLEEDFLNITERCLKRGTLLVTPQILIEKPLLYMCESCGKKSLLKKNVCSTAKGYDLVFSDFSVIFLDDNCIIYESSSEQPSDASAQEQPELQAVLADPLESLETPVALPKEEHQP